MGRRPPQLHLGIHGQAVGGDGDLRGIYVGWEGECFEGPSLDRFPAGLGGPWRSIAVSVRVRIVRSVRTHAAGRHHRHGVADRAYRRSVVPPITAVFVTAVVTAHHPAMVAVAHAGPNRKFHAAHVPNARRASHAPSIRQYVHGTPSSVLAVHPNLRGSIRGSFPHFHFDVEGPAVRFDEGPTAAPSGVLVRVSRPSLDPAVVVAASLLLHMGRDHHGWMRTVRESTIDVEGRSRIVVYRARIIASG
mmetsp:Transcript_13477/g.32669  ORF Transcript_13477/g.32669 Transcript_13477/m.32669 type:complete len:247 (-) Transcript_13477:253-993(-)